jgi:esterase/lipase superfamily enzyme
MKRFSSGDLMLKQTLRSGGRSARTSKVEPSPKPLRFVAFSAAVSLGLAGCANNIKGFLLPVAATAPGASQVEMIVATTRTRAATPDELFAGGRSDKPQFADIVVSIPPDITRRSGEVEWPKQLPGNPATDFVTLKADVIDKPQAIASFSRILKKTPGRQVLVFVHGFNNRFEDAVYRFAQIVHDSRAVAAPVLFTWPSRGSLFAYGYDRESANFSRDALENLLRWLSDNPQVSEVSVLAHSMGNWVTLEALRQMAIRDGRVAPKIKTVLLAAPDVDVDLAREQIATMGAQRPKFTLFLSEDDKALAASREVWGAPRLGAVNPEVEPYKTILANENINVINLTSYKGADGLDHGKFADNARAIELVGSSLANGQTLSDSRVGLGEKILSTTAGAAHTLGHVAGVVVSAPVAIVDPLTRDHFDEEVDAMGESTRHIAPPK